MTSENGELSPDLHAEIKKLCGDGDILAESGRVEDTNILPRLEYDSHMVLWLRLKG